MIKYSHFIEEKPVARNGLPKVTLTSRMMIDERGREVLDKTPVQAPVNLGAPPSSLLDFIHELYRQQRENEEVESFEDANNFDIPDEIGIEMMDTPYEQDFDHLGETAGAVPAPNESAPVPSPTPEPVQE